MTNHDSLPGGAGAGPMAIPAETERPEMARGEKVAWLSLTGMAIGYGFYFVAIAIERSNGTATFLRFIVLLTIASVVRALIEGIGNAILAAGARAEGQGKADERDRSISRRGASVAYYVLMAGALIVGMIMPFTYGGWDIVNAALAAVVLAETVRNAVVLRSYRRGWHG
jgi:hypothetical protein